MTEHPRRPEFLAHFASLLQEPEACLMSDVLTMGAEFDYLPGTLMASIKTAATRRMLEENHGVILNRLMYRHNLIFYADMPGQEAAISEAKQRVDDKKDEDARQKRLARSVGKTSLK